MRKMFLSVPSLLTFLVLVVTQNATAQEVRAGTLKVVQGDVSLVKGDMHRMAVLGGGVAESERIVTGPGALASLLLKDGTVVAVGPGTTVDLSRFQFEPTTQSGGMLVHLLQGSMRVVTGLLGKLHPDKVAFTTPTSVIGVRGTDFIVEVP
jgi:hypothetical protein